MENLKKNPLSLQLNVEDFAPASNDEKKSLVVMRESVNFWKDGMRRLRKNKIAMVSLVVILLIAFMAYVLPSLWPYSYELQIKGSNNLAPFEYSAAEQKLIDAGEKVFPHILGTDRMGRDFAVRVMMGTRVSLSVGLLASVLVLLIGATYGAISAFAGGWIDNIMMRITDILYTIPDILLIILLAMAIKEPLEGLATKPGFGWMQKLGPNMVSIFIIFALLYWVGMARIVRSQVLTLKESEYVTAARALGASGARRWRLINDTVGSMLGGMASCDRSRYADFIGFILGTGTNACCHVKACDVTKSPETVAMGGETLVNLESGCFGRALRGTADIAVDEASGLPGDHPAEKMISGAYYRLLLRETLLLAAKEGFLSAKSGENIAALSVTSAMVDAFCLDPMGGNAVAEALETEKDRRFASEINTMLLERAARIAAACLCAILRERGFGAGTLTGICADGTMLKLNPVLRPRMEALIAEYTKRHGLGGAEFLFAGDATLLGCAWAALA